MLALNPYLYLAAERNEYAINYFMMLAYLDTIDYTHEFLLTRFTFYCS